MATTAAHIETRLSVAIHAVLHNASAHTSFTSNLACDFTASTARNEAAAGADRALARASSLPPTAHHRAPPHHWTPDELQQVSESGSMHGHVKALARTCAHPACECGCNSIAHHGASHMPADPFVPRQVGRPNAEASRTQGPGSSRY